MAADEDVVPIGRKVVYDGYFRLDRYRLRHRQFAGGMGPVLTREILERGRVVATLPVDPARDRRRAHRAVPPPGYSTVTLLARLRGWSMSRPRASAQW